MKKNLCITVVMVGMLALVGAAYAHHASFEADLEGGDSTLENPWRVFDGDFTIAFDHFSYLDAGDVDYISFDAAAGLEIADLFVCFSASLKFLPKAAIVGPGLSGGSVPDWVEIPEGMGVMNYEYALDWLTEEGFGELDNTIVLVYDEARPFTLPEDGTYLLVIYNEDQKSGYYDIALGEDHSRGDNAENWEQKLDDWVVAALAHDASAVADWQLFK